MFKKIIIGIIAGIISGLFSTGGGMILVPSFIYILKMGQVESRATSILCVLTMVCVTSFFYAQNKYIDFRIGVLAAIGGVIGSFIGSKCINKISDKSLKLIFIGFLIYMGVNMIIR